MSKKTLPPEASSPRAFAHYRALVEAANASPVYVQTSFDLTDAALHWHALTAFEVKAYGLDPRLLNAMVRAYQRYLELAGMVEAEFADFHDEEIAAYAGFLEDGCYSMDKAIAFMVVACGIPETQALLL